MNKKILKIIRNYDSCRPCDNDKVVRSIPIAKNIPKPTTKPIPLTQPLTQKNYRKIR